MVHKVAKHGDLVLELHLDKKDLEEKAKDACVHLLQDWKHLQPKDIQVSEISGGITNVLWKLEAGGGSLDPVVVRIFGQQTDRIIDRGHERRVLGPLNAAGFGAQVLATFENGRIEEFLKMRPLKPKEMTESEMAGRIASRLKQFHQVEVGTASEPQLFATIEKWVKQGRELDFSDDKQKANKHTRFDFARMQQSVTRVKELAARLDLQACFTHNDLLSGNVLVPEQGSAEVQFIDFEYSSYTYATFDIANHFCEYAGFECDYSRFPGNDHMRRFMCHYLSGGVSDPADEEAIEKAVVECKLLALAAHQFWGSWGLLQAKYSPINFDYIEYSKSRWDECYKREQEFVQQAETWLKGKN